MRFRKVYLEISNICNLSCRFCPGTKRPKKAMTEEELAVLLPKIRPYTDYLYFHLMGEPLLHKNLERFLEMAGSYGFKVILTTNGTLLKKQQEMLLSSPALHKVNVSLHAFEANVGGKSLEDYVQGCLEFGKAMAGRKIVVYRLWNQGGKDALNDQILEQLHEAFPQEWEQQRQGIRIRLGQPRTVMDMLQMSLGCHPENVTGVSSIQLEYAPIGRNHIIPRFLPSDGIQRAAYILPCRSDSCR